MVEGADRLRRRLTQVMPEKVRLAVRAALEQGAEEIVQTMRNFVHVDSGALRASIGWTWGQPPVGSFEVDSLKSAFQGERIRIYAGSKDAFYARWEEFGTSPGFSGDKAVNSKGRVRRVGRSHPGTRAHPFFYPAYRLHKKRVKSRVARALRKAVKAL